MSQRFLNAQQSLKEYTENKKSHAGNMTQMEINLDSKGALSISNFNKEGR